MPHTVKIVHTEQVTGEKAIVREYEIWWGHSPSKAEHIAEWGQNLILSMIGKKE